MISVKNIFNKFIRKTNVVQSTKGLLHNTYVLYFVFLAVLFNLLHSVVKGDYFYCILFLLIGFIVSFLNKNMIVILVITVAFATILNNVLIGNKLSLEGFEDDMEKKRVSDEKNKKEKEDDKPETKPPTPTEVRKDTSARLMETLKEQAYDLQDAQTNIIRGFEKIEPYMNKAETLISTIQDTTEKIKQLSPESGISNP